jgi:hypothetical protein
MHASPSRIAHGLDDVFQLNTPELLLDFVTKRFAHVNAGDLSRQCRHLDTLRYFDAIIRHQASNPIETLLRLN